MHSKRNKTIAGAMGAAGVAATAAIMVGAGAGSAVAGSAEEKTAAAVDKAKATFSVLRRAESAADVDSPFAISAARLGVDQADVRRVRLGTQWDVWAAPSADGACVSFAGPGDRAGNSATVCAPMEVVAREGLVGVSEPAPGSGDLAAQVVTLVPDGVETVSVELADGSTVQTEAADNVAAVAVRSKPKKMSFVDGKKVKRSVSLSKTEAR